MYFLQKFKICRADHSINFSFMHLKLVKNITQFDLYFSCILWRLQNLKSEASFERITIKTIRHIFRNISDRFYYFASSFIIFSTSEISISSISAICSIENLLDNFLTSSCFSSNFPSNLPSAIPYCFISIFSSHDCIYFTSVFSLALIWQIRLCIFWIRSLLHTSDTSSVLCSIYFKSSINSGDTSSKLHSINWNQQLPVAYRS